MPSPWRPFMEAPCGFGTRVAQGFESGFFVKGVCLGCGKYHGRDDFKVKSVRAVFKGKWYKPWTWLNFETEERLNDLEA